MATRPPPGSRLVAIRAGKVLDVRTGNYGSDQIIWIDGEKIKAIGNAGHPSVSGRSDPSPPGTDSDLYFVQGEEPEVAVERIVGQF
jgi:hypothetical protein